MAAPSKRTGRWRAADSETLTDGNAAHSDPAALQSQAAIDPATHPIIARHWFGLVVEDAAA